MLGSSFHILYYFLVETSDKRKALPDGAWRFLFESSIEFQPDQQMTEEL